MREVVIVEAVRTPVGRRGGALKDVHPVVLAVTKVQLAVSVPEDASAMESGSAWYSAGRLS